MTKTIKLLITLISCGFVLAACQFLPEDYLQSESEPALTESPPIADQPSIVTPESITQEPSPLTKTAESLPPTPSAEPSDVTPPGPNPVQDEIFDVFVPAQVDKFKKLEISFQLDGLADQNKQIPHLSAEDANEFTQTFAGIGVSVDAVLTGPDGVEYRQPGFWYEEYDELAPTENDRWMVRFAPHLAGEWQVRLMAEHRDGRFESAPYAFTVVESEGRGFLQVAEQDGRYFEFDNGEYYSNIGFNLSIKDLDDVAQIEKLTASGVNYARAWVSQMNITGGAWSHLSMKPVVYDGYLPRDAVTRYRPEGKTAEEFWWRLATDHEWYSSCLYTNQEFEQIRVEPNREYLIETEFATYSVAPADVARDYGYTVIIQDWVDNCNQLDASNAVIPHSGDQNQQNLVSSGVWNSGDNLTIPYVYLALENVSAGDAYVKSVSIREMRSDGSLGPELFIDYKADKRQFYSQRESAILDEMVELAEENELYLRLVLSEKEDPLFTKSDQYGRPTDLNKQLFYGSGREVQANRYLQMAWWRYVQARWGYSTAIHSWELLNEGDPFNEDHYALADEMGKYMNCTVFGVEIDGNDCVYDHPNGHLVSTSFWHSFPAEQFWGNSDYPNIDFADQHKYLPTEDVPIHEDLTTAVLELSNTIGYGVKNVINKPVLRGETGLVDAGTAGPIAALRSGDNPVWLHNMLWSSLNAGGVIEAGYWYPYEHIYNNEFDHLAHFSEFARFVKSIPLNNGHYSALNGSFSAESYPLVGQIDGANQQAHGWMRHPDFTWKNVDDGQTEFGISGMLTLTGFEADRSYTVLIQSYGLNSGYNTYSQSITADESGNLIISLNTIGDAGSVAFKIE